MLVHLGVISIYQLVVRLRLTSKADNQSKKSESEFWANFDFEPDIMLKYVKHPGCFDFWFELLQRIQKYGQKKVLKKKVSIWNSTWNSAVIIPLFSCLEFHFLKNIGINLPFKCQNNQHHQGKPDYEPVRVDDKKICNVVIREQIGFEENHSDLKHTMIRK